MYLHVFVRPVDCIMLIHLMELADGCLLHVENFQLLRSCLLHVHSLILHMYICISHKYTIESLFVNRKTGHATLKCDWVWENRPSRSIFVDR